ncbi:unnamed protein product [Ophioblennius macclurei]
MTPRSCVRLLLLLCALLADTQALCDNSCPAKPNLPTTISTTEITAVGCNFSTADTNSTNGLITGLTPGTVYEIQFHCSNCCKTVTTKPETVKDLDATSTTSSIFVSWTEVGGKKSGYRINLTNGVEEVRTTETSRNITDLTAGTLYHVTVTAVAEDNVTEGEGSTLQKYTKPEVVVNLKVTDKTTSSIYLSWTKPNGSNSFYRVNWTDGLTDSYQNVTETYKNVTGLTAGVRYTFTVQSVAGDNQTESETKEISSYTQPDRVINLNATDITTSSIYLTWTKPNGDNSFYRIEWRDDLSNSHMNVTERNEINVTGLTPGVRYTFTVQSVAGDNQTESEKSRISSYTRPTKPKNIAVTDRGTDYLNLTWDLFGETDHFEVNIWNAALKNLPVINTNVSSASFTSLLPGRVYDVNVTAVAGGFQSTSDKKSFATIPTPPRKINITSRTNSSITLAWLTPDGMDGAPNVSYSYSYQHAGFSNNTTENHATLSSLSSGTEYCVNVTTIGPEYLTSTAGNICSFTLPNPVLNLVVQPESNTSVTVRWSAPAGVQRYYNYSVKVLNTTRGRVKLTDDSARITDLEPATQYFISVRTVADQDAMSDPVEGSNYTRPNAVTNLKVVHENATSIQLQWLSQNDHRPSFTYEAEAIRDGMLAHNRSTQSDTVTFDGLIPGTPYEFRVFAVISGVRSEPASIERHSKPEVASGISVTGNTTTLFVSWEPGSGLVSSYSVHLFKGEDPIKNKTDQSNTTTSAIFSDLDPGVDYCVVVVTRSGPVASNSSAVCNATFPNPPGSITVQSQNATSLNFTWTLPAGMSRDQYNFSVTTVKGSLLTTNNWYLLGLLTSGSPYNISVATVGVRGYESTQVTAQNYTRPYPVNSLRVTEITTDAVTLEWSQPENKSDYSYLVTFPNNGTRVTSPNAIITGLESGSNISFTVTTLAADGTESDPMTVYTFTRPHPVLQLSVETLNTTAVRPSWTKPRRDKKNYQYLVEVTGCGDQSKLVVNESVEISGLTPGTNCTVCVTVQVESTKGEQMCTSQYTEPEAVLPTVFTQSNDSIQVSWTKPGGNVEKYLVILSRSSSDSHGSAWMKSVQLDGSSTGYLFENLSSGRLYSAEVIAHSGPYNATSGLKENATFPNPPGPIEIISKTTSEIRFRWTEAPLMESAKFSYRLTLTQALLEGSAINRSVYGNTTSSSFDWLPSGTTFVISVSTVGIWDFESEKVNVSVTTRPLNVKLLTSTESETRIQVSWERPDDYKTDYRYNVTWKRPNQDSSGSVLVEDVSSTVDKLMPGSRYNISVTTETSDGTQAEPRWISKCTRADKVPDLICRGPNTVDAQIILSWPKPIGQNSGFRVTANGINETIACCGHNVSGLSHSTQYNITIETLSCGQASIEVTRQCTTGITYPPIPQEYGSLARTETEKHNRFSIRIDRSLFNSTKGPIKHVGVLVKKTASGDCSNCTDRVGKTYAEFKNGDTSVYLATVTPLTSSRNAQELNIEVGDDSVWEGYRNGALDANTNYQYAIVLFTSLDLKKDRVDSSTSLFSVTPFGFSAHLHQDPVVIGMAVGTTLGIFCVLLIILIGFIIFWKRMSKKESPEIQIQSLRNAPVRVEDYEAYFRKQRADSNCGFAEEFEDLKTVGTAQVKIHALSLENKPKNRYTNVLPYDSSRVKLSIIHGSPHDDYINANYVPGYNSRKEFIAAQGPLPATVNEFWRMIWEKNVQTLVMLTRCNEQGRVKCEQYWSPGTKHFGNVTVTTTSEIPLEDWTIREFTIKNLKTTETRSVRHFHFTAWPDHGVPETTELLISFRHLVREHMNQYSKHSPTVVHCSAGVGRTGTFIAIDHLIFQIERENIVDVYGVVHELRMHRALMVQTEDQYIFLNQCALDIIRSRTGTNVDLIYQNTAALSIYENLEPHRQYSKNRNQNT